MATSVVSFNAFLKSLYSPHSFDELSERHVSKEEWESLPKKGRPTLEEYREVRRIMRQ